MRFELHANELRVSTSLEKAINNKVGKIEERLKRYHPDAADLELRLDHLPKVNEYECALVLRAFKETLHAKKA
ncbi:MAG: hypothetical protein GWO16_13095, partial [Gammaproteobacteria bacterium]|nr:hypothetical protein [Gammaproteobacteria bacterium]NIR97848.1 hypothetical protein [Gammaproteobacteria bacterium]NIT64541.1 hypothetical protein [Gammaproteobacteria bacterium]NIV20492.1 hypothetical protein [Gammaproteobacteria bacterium]NIX11430.1 hypothetical protein [Gammaproteobacteria bacterium]